MADHTWKAGFMDLTSIIGFLMAVGMVLFPYLTVSDPQNVPMALFFVFGGTLGATVLSVPRRHLRAALSGLAIAFVEKRGSARELVRSLVELGETSRRDGILSLETRLDTIRDPFLRKGVALAVDGTTTEVIEATLEQEIEQTHSRHEAGKSVLELVARYAPAYGMLGTLTGLIHMLNEGTGQDPLGTYSDTMLPKMAFALITTFCGIFLANTIALPLSDKLSEKDREEILNMKIVVQGILAIQTGDNPRLIREKLNIYLPPEERV